MAKRKRPAAVRPIEYTCATYPIIGEDIPMVSGTGRPQSSEYQEAAVYRGVAGYLRVIVGGKDVTYFRGVETRVSSIDHQEPFGATSATITFSQITPLNRIYTNHDFWTWLDEGKTVKIELVKANKTVRVPLFYGYITAMRETTDSSRAEWTAECEGILRQAELTLAQQQICYDEEDIGHVIARLLNGVPGRRYGRCQPVTTGITTFSTGAFDNKLTGRIQDLLAEACDEDGKQWTLNIDPGTRRPRIEMKDYETVDWIIYKGGKGVEIDLVRDRSEAPTHLYGAGVDRKGNGWGNLRIPEYSPKLKNTPGDPDDDGLEPYPFSDPAETLSLGSTNGATDTGNGVTVLQKRLRERGIKIAGVTGTFDANTRLAVRKWQKKRGLVADGVCGGQTWCDLFYAGPEGNAFYDAYYAPLAFVSEAEPYLYYADGSIKGPNPDYDPDRLRVEKYQAYPDGTSKAKAIESAQRQLQRDKHPGWTDTITLTIDPLRGDGSPASKFEMKAGDNILVKNHRAYGGELLLHITAIVFEPQDDGRGGRAVLTVDSLARDHMTLSAIQERKRLAKNPARREAKERRSELSSSKPPIDLELLGYVHAVTSADGLWSVIKVPLGTRATINRINFEITNTATPFVCAFFASQITPNELSRIGNPWEMKDGRRPVSDPDISEFLEQKLIIDVLGGPDQRAGFYPGAESEGDVATGVHKDSSISLSFTSERPPYMWMAFYTGDTPAILEGRIFVAPDGT